MKLVRIGARFSAKHSGSSHRSVGDAVADKATAKRANNSSSFFIMRFPN
jgi:hypothetical protein